MCGIVGLYLKNPKLKSKLGAMFKPMLIEMTNRGPDSAGVAIYRNPTKKSETKFSLAHDNAKPSFHSPTMTPIMIGRRSIWAWKRP